MAFDTQAKRMAVAGVGRPWMRAQFPDATKGEEWRINVGLGYGGNLLSASGFDYITLDVLAKRSDTGAVLAKRHSTEAVLAKRFVTLTQER